MVSSVRTGTSDVRPTSLQYVLYVPYLILATRDDRIVRYQQGLHCHPLDLSTPRRLGDEDKSRKRKCKRKRKANEVCQDAGPVVHRFNQLLNVLVPGTSDMSQRSAHGDSRWLFLWRMRACGGHVRYTADLVLTRRESSRVCGYTQFYHKGAVFINAPILLI
jgi:hypothetical protein